MNRCDRDMPHINRGSPNVLNTHYTGCFVNNAFVLCWHVRLPVHLDRKILRFYELKFGLKV